MKYIFGIASKTSSDYKKFVLGASKIISSQLNSVQLAYTPNSILSYIAVDNFDAIFVDWEILAGNFKAFREQLWKINKHVPLIIVANNFEINGELFIPCSSLFRVIPQASFLDNLPVIQRDIKQYYKLLVKLPVAAKSDIAPNGFRSMVGNSSVMLNVYNQLAKVSQTDFTTLILGDSGCGKELAANIVHDLSTRNNQLLISLNCAAIPSTLQESELFGYEKGAFTDATMTKEGKFELADRGTLFFDEIGDMPLDLQSKLLRVLESNSFTRLGGTIDKIIDLRYIAATNRNLHDLVKENKFRFDLFYRINVIPISLPMLKERDNDLVLLCLYFIAKMIKDGSLSVNSITWDFINELKKLRLMGNIRELENILTRTLFNSSGSVLDVKSLTEIDILDQEIASSSTETQEFNGEIIPLDKIEKIAINNALNQHRGNVTKVAKALQISRSSLYRKMKQYNIEN